eukprot:9482674-Pyramimonas_sp.AAC.1
MRGIALKLPFWRLRKNARIRIRFATLDAPAPECAGSRFCCDSGRACARMRGVALYLRFSARVRQRMRSCAVFALLGARAPENAESRSS